MPIIPLSLAVKNHTDTRKILITGATGFLGSHLIKKLIKAVPPSEIVCLIPEGSTVRVAGAGIIESRLLDEYRRLGVTIHPYPAWGTVEEYQKAFESLGSIGTVIYLAANNNRALGNERLFRDNVETLKRFIAALDTRLKDAHFIFASSVMAETAGVLIDRYGQPTVLKLNPYACTKLAAEAVLKEEQQRLGYRLLILRFASIYGKESQWGLMKSVHSLAALSKKIPVPYLRGRAHIVHVNDVTLALTKAVSSPLTGTFDVNASPLLTIGELVERCAASEGAHAKQVRLPAFVSSIAASFFGFGSRLGIPAALQLQSLFTDIYVGHGSNVLDALDIHPALPFTNAPVLAEGAFTDSVAVIGASGFIGSRIVRILSSRGWKVRCGIHHASLPLENLEDSNIEYVACDTSDPSSLAAFLKGQRTVVYAGGLTTAHGKKTWEDYLHANVLEVISLVSLMRRAHVKQIIFLASQAPARGKYGLSKSLGEQIVRASKLEYTILKPGLVVGDRGLVSMLFKLVKLAPVFPLPSHTPRNTELVDVDAIGDAVAEILEEGTGRYTGATIYLGSSKSVSFEDMVHTISVLSKKRTLFISLPKWSFRILSAVGTLVPFFPFNKEMFEGIYRQKDDILEESMRLKDEEPEAIFKRHIRN